MSKNKLLDWVDEQAQLDTVSKYILDKLARYADADCCAWAKVATLAGYVNKSERTVQQRLRLMQEQGLLKDTGRTHRLEGSTRSVPVYQMAPDVEGLGKRSKGPDSMGAKSAPIAAHGCRNDGGMGEAVFTRIEPRNLEQSNDCSERGREREDSGSEGQGEGLDVAALERLFAQVEAAYPRLGLGFSDRSMAWRAFLDLAGQGVDVAQLPGAAARYAADPVLRKRDFGPVSLQRWLSEGRYRAWMPAAEAEAVAGAAPPKAAWLGPPEIRAAAVSLRSEGWATRLDRCGWDPERRAIVAPGTNTASDINSVLHLRLRDMGVSVVVGEMSR